MKETKFNHGHRWTDDEIKTLMRLWAEEKTLAEISDEMPMVSQYAAGKMVVRLRQQGIPLKRRTAGGGATGRRAGKPWTQEEIAYLARRRMDRATSEEIGIELGRSHAAIAGMIQRLRAEEVPIAMRGNGVRRLWDADALRRSLIISDPENTNIIRIDESEAARNFTKATAED